MTKSLRFWVLLVLQLCIPAVLYLLVGLYNGNGMELDYLLPNYLYMAFPHLLVSLLALWPRNRRPAILWVLSLLNMLLIVFKLWVMWVVTGRESGLAWIFYIPLWGTVLFVSAIIWLATRHKVYCPPADT